MNILTVPVTIFSRKLILAKYGTEPIRLAAADTLTGAICCIKPGDANKIDKTKTTLTTQVEFVLNSNLAKHINTNRLWRIGLHLHDWHREKLNDYIESKVEEGINATTAIHQYCEDHDIELDVDINFEALYKDWQRFISKKNAKNMSFFHRQKQKSVHRVGEKMTIKTLFTDTELDTLVANYTTAHAHLFSTLRGAPRKKLHRQLELYVYRKIGNRTPQYICKKFGLTESYLLKRKSTIPPTPKGSLPKPIASKPRRVDYDSKLRYAVRQFAIFLNTAPPII